MSRKTLALLLLGVLVGCSRPNQIPDEPLPGRDALLAAFPEAADETVILRERDLRAPDSLRCVLPIVRSEGFGLDDRATLNLSAETDETDESFPLRDLDAYFGRSASEVAPGDTLSVYVFSSGCDGDNGEGNVSLYVTSFDDNVLDGVFEGDLSYIPEAYGPIGRSYRLLGRIRVLRGQPGER